MIVVSDTSPISNLIVIGKLELLRKVFGVIIVPDAVYQEVEALRSFNVDLNEFTNAKWIRRETVQDTKTFQKLIELVDVGEAQALTIAGQLHSDFLLMDEKKGRSIAKEMGIKTIGLIGILVKAKKENYIVEVKSILDELINVARFRISEALYKEVLLSAGEQH